MKRRIYKSLTLLFILLLSSCESYQIHDELDGFWQVKSIENKQTGDIIHCNGDIYYSFQRDLVLVSYVSPDIPAGQMKENYIAYFTHENDSIYMTDFRIYIDKEAPQVPLSRLEKFGLYERYNNLYIENLDYELLIMSSNWARIVLMKH
ncbi:MAG: lipocalin-like domain-containing protein [Bacteroidaceae bacterium]|nr:lipocalin-like domain-containing protein [Bacteroidaceae bacterium]